MPCVDEEETDRKDYGNNSPYKRNSYSGLSPFE
jgi:hypothetical protein